MYNTEEAKKIQKVLNLKDKIIGLAGVGNVEDVEELMLAIEEAKPFLEYLIERGSSRILPRRNGKSVNECFGS